MLLADRWKLNPVPVQLILATHTSRSISCRNSQASEGPVCPLELTSGTHRPPDAQESSGSLAEQCMPSGASDQLTPAAPFERHQLRKPARCELPTCFRKLTPAATEAWRNILRRSTAA